MCLLIVLVDILKVDLYKFCDEVFVELSLKFCLLALDVSDPSETLHPPRPWHNPRMKPYRLPRQRHRTAVEIRVVLVMEAHTPC